MSTIPANLVSLIKTSGANALPDKPSANNYGAKAIKNAIVRSSEILAQHLVNVGSVLDGVASDLADFEASVGNTYVTLAGNNTITGANTFTGDTTYDANVWFSLGYSALFEGTVKIYNDTFVINGMKPEYDKTSDLGSSSKRWSNIYTNNLHVYSGAITNGTHTFTLPSVTGTLATTIDTAAVYLSANTYTDNEIAKVQDGTYTAKKATQDGDGETISSTYVKKSQIYDGVDSTSTTVPLSANQGKVLKGLIDAIQTLLASDDSTLDELQEIVTYIKNNKSLIDGVTASKVSVSDIVDNLTTQVATKPLSANQGYVLDQKIGDLTDDYIALGLVEVGDYNQSTGEITITHSTNLTSSYDSTTGVLTITY